MLIISIIFNLFLVCSSHASVIEWEAQINTLISGEGDKSKAIATLRGVKDLDSRLMRSLEKGGKEERLALIVIRALPRVTMIDYLLKKIKGIKPNDLSAESRFVTLCSLVQTEKGDEIIKTLQKEVPLISPKFSAPLRISLLSALDAKNVMVPPETLKKLLDDPSYEMRMKAMQVAENGIKLNPKNYLNFLTKALELKPYPVRILAVDYIAGLPKDLKLGFKKEILNCAKNDTQPMVKDNCLQVSRSFE